MKNTANTQLLIKQALRRLYQPLADSHKGQNGRLLIIGGSELFHAASKWSLDVASKLVDMVFYASVPSNNQLIQQQKQEFWNGIVIERKHIPDYIEEADAILIGPGMDRSWKTKWLVNRLVKKYQDKKWVIDAGALQMIQPKLLNANHIITPHHQEIKLLQQFDANFNPDNYQANCYCLLKGRSDQLLAPKKEQIAEISGGNAGMTKGGSGDVLAGLLAALYCKNDATTSMIIASYINKKAGENLYHQQGYYFNSSDLAETIPSVLWQELIAQAP